MCLNSDLTPSMHCSNIAAMAFNRSCLLLKCFHSNDVSLLVRLYKVNVRPLLESNTQVWNPWFHKDIQCIERVQRFFTRAIIKRAGIPYMDYDDRLANLGLQSLESSTTLSCATRSIITWLIYLLRVFSPNRLGRIPSEVILVSCDPNIYPIMHSERRVIPIWNHLPHDVVTSLNITVFRTRLRSVDLSPFCTLYPFHV